MAKHLKVMLEIGPKGKRVVAVAPDWPGLERGAKTEGAAIERLLAYVPRYAKVAKLAGLESSFPVNPVVDVVERYPGTGSTDFWGISFAFSKLDHQVLTTKALERELTLMQACWALFDQVRSHVSAELQKGPRGGGRDRDRIVLHIFANEQDWGKKLGLQTPDEAMQSRQGWKAYRQAYCDGIREYHSGKKMARTWPLRYLIRHTAYHTLDHTWEMQDRDLMAK